MGVREHREVVSVRLNITEDEAGASPELYFKQKQNGSSTRLLAFKYMQRMAC